MCIGSYLRSSILDGLLADDILVSPVHACILAVGSKQLLMSAEATSDVPSYMQVRALEQQTEELSGLLGRQSGDVAAQSADGAAGNRGRRSMDSANGRSLASSVSGSEAFVPSAAGSEDDEAAAAAEAGADPAAVLPASKEGAPGAEEAGEAAAAAATGAASGASHPLADTAPAAEPPAAQSPATPPAKSAPVDVPQLEAVRRESREFRSSSQDSPSRDSPSRHTFDAAGSAVSARLIPPTDC